MKTLLRRVLDVLGSFGLACVLLVILFVLTYLGTIHQVEHGLYQAKKLYFESFVVVDRHFGVPLLLPGGALTLGLLAVNLLVGGLWRIRKSRRTAGVIVGHVGIAFLLLAGLVEYVGKEEGHLLVWPGERKSWFEDVHAWELVVWEADQTSNVLEFRVPDSELSDAAGDGAVTFHRDELPFDLVVSRYARNARPVPAAGIGVPEGPVVDGWTLRAIEPAQQAARNLPGAHVRLLPNGGGDLRDGIVWGGERAPWVATVGGKRWAFTLRRELHDLPFALRLDDFTKEDYPGMNRPRVFASDVTKFEDEDEQAIRIEMNEPLRHGGYVFFQTDWGPKEVEDPPRMYSVLTVVRNPSDNWPLYACIVIALGLLLTFGERLLRFLRAQAKKRAARAAATTS